MKTLKQQEKLRQLINLHPLAVLQHVIQYKIAMEFIRMLLRLHEDQFSTYKMENYFNGSYEKYVVC